MVYRLIYSLAALAFFGTLAFGQQNPVPQYAIPAGPPAHTTGWSYITAGTAGYVLTSNGPSAYPTWQPGGGGGGSVTCAGLPALTGDVTTSAGSCATTIAAMAVTYSKMQNVTGQRLLGNPTGVSASPSEISLGATLAFSGTALQTGALTGDVTAAANSFATTIANNAVTNAKQATAGANTIKGNWTSGTTNVSDNAMPSCADSGGNHLNYVSGTGITCGTSTPTLSGAAGTVLTGTGSGSSFSATPTLGVAGTTLGSVALAGNTSGTVTIKPQAAAGTYNFNVPTTAGSSGQPMLSGGGGASPMTFGTLGVGGGGTGLTSGTSGGMPYFSSTSTLASSGLLTQYGLIYGGGAGGSPAALGAMTNGQILVGVTSNPPSVATPSGDIASISTGGAFTIANNAVTNAKAAQAGANTMKGNWTGSTANVADNAMPSCPDSGGNHLNYVSGTGITCGTSGGGGGTTTTSPEGRLTLTSGTPVLGWNNVTDTSSLYYTCFRGKYVLYYNGSADAYDTIPSCEVSTTLQTTGTGVLNSGGVFDVWWEGNTNHNICVATNGSGGGWASDTGGSNTARGTGYTQLNLTARGYYTNANSVTHCYNGSTDYGTITANKLTYLGTIYTTAAGKVRWTPNQTNTASVLGLWNMYNRVASIGYVLDTSAAATYTASTIRYCNGNSYNSISFVRGVQQEPLNYILNLRFTIAAVAGAYVIAGPGLDTSVAITLQGLVISNDSGSGLRYDARATTGVWFGSTLGFHTFNCLDLSDGTNASYFNSASFNSISIEGNF